MASRPTSRPVEAVRPSFRTLRELRDRHLPGGLLSMGMSHDFEVAIEEGADLVRIGSQIFFHPSPASEGAPSMIVKVRVIPNAMENEVVSRIGSVSPCEGRRSGGWTRRPMPRSRITSRSSSRFPESAVSILRGANGREKDRGDRRQDRGAAQAGDGVDPVRPLHTASARANEIRSRLPSSYFQGAANQ